MFIQYTYMMNRIQVGYILCVSFLKMIYITCILISHLLTVQQPIIDWSIVTSGVSGINRICIPVDPFDIATNKDTYVRIFMY